MESGIDQHIQSIGKDIENLANNHIEYAKLSVVERLALLGGRLSVLLVKVVLVALCAFFALIGVAIAVGYGVENMALGFIIVAGSILVLVMLFTLFAKRTVSEGISNIIIASFLEEVDDEN